MQAAFLRLHRDEKLPGDVGEVDRVQREDLLIDLFDQERNDGHVNP